MIQSIESVEFIQAYIQHNYPDKQIKSIHPYSFTLGSDNNGEGLTLEFGLQRSLFFGMLYLNINPKPEIELQEEKIEIKYRSYFNDKPFWKYITRYVERENLINENSSSIELFDSLTVTQQSTKYDFYFTFVGYKIDLI